MVWLVFLCCFFVNIFGTCYYFFLSYKTQDVRLKTLGFIENCFFYGKSLKSQVSIWPFFVLLRLHKNS